MRRHTPSAKKNASLKAAWLKRGPQTVEDYIKSKIIKIGGCHLWKGAKEGKYGYFQFKYNVGSAHIKVFETFNGKIPKGKCVLHTCDDQRCVKLKHLYLGDRKDNRRDFMERHSRAMEICLAAQKIAAKGSKNFWKNMTKKEREKFIARRNKKFKIAVSKIPGFYKNRVKNTWTTRRASK